MFIYRLLQTTQSPYLKYVADMKYYCLFFVIYIILIVLLYFIPGHMILLYGDDLAENLKTVDPEAFKHLGDYAALGLNVSIFLLSLKKMYTLNFQFEHSKMISIR